MGKLKFMNIQPFVMSDNLLSSIVNIINYGNLDLSLYATKSEIRINAAGERLEFYIKDSLANSFHISGEHEKKKAHQKICSWLGNQNNPPDIIIRGGDAFEIKKSIGKRGGIQLNSTHPKNMLHVDDPKIISHVKNCEPGWKEKDIFYVMGQVQNQQLNHLFYIHGKCYAADRKIYQKIVKIVSEATQNANLEFQRTNELGRVNRVDPLGITTLRIRGMWIIKHPNRVFSYIYSPPKHGFGLVVLMLKEKYESYPEENRMRIINHNLISVKEVQIDSPNNKANRLDAVLITFQKEPPLDP
jgi:hypothetical protein